MCVGESDVEKEEGREVGVGIKYLRSVSDFGVEIHFVTKRLLCQTKVVLGADGPRFHFDNRILKDPYLSLF